MEVVIYKAKGKNGYLYDMSFDPNVDFEVMKKTRRIEAIDVLSPKIPIQIGEAILNDIYGKSLIKKFIGSHDYIIKRNFSKNKIKVKNTRITSGCHLPEQEKISEVEDVIAGKVISLESLHGLFRRRIDDYELIQIIQLLYCQRRIKIMPATRTKKNKSVCSFCEKSSCDTCCLGFEKDDVLVYEADNYNIGIPRNISYNKPKMDEHLHNASRKVVNFLRNSKRNEAVLWCVPKTFKLCVLSEAIADVIEAGGKVLYITSNTVIRSIQSEIRSIFKNVVVDYAEKNGTLIKDKDIVVCSYNNYLCFHKAFDFVIYDDTMAYIDTPLKNMLEISKRAVKERGKLLNITSFPEISSKNKKSVDSEMIYIPVTEAKGPIPEPLIVIARTFREQIPEIAIDMVKWSIKDKLKILVLVPTYELQKSVFNNLTILGDIDADLIEFSNTEDKSSILKLIKKDISVVISNDIKDIENKIEDINVIVINADNPVYNRYILMQTSVMAEVHNKKRCGEVMFIVEKENEEVNVTKERIRGVNKIAWESGMIRI